MTLIPMIGGQELSKDSYIFTSWFNNEHNDAHALQRCFKWKKLKSSIKDRNIAKTPIFLLLGLIMNIVMHMHFKDASNGKN